MDPGLWIWLAFIYPRSSTILLHPSRSLQSFIFFYLHCLLVLWKLVVVAEDWSAMAMATITAAVTSLHAPSQLQATARSSPAAFSPRASLAVGSGTPFSLSIQFITFCNNGPIDLYHCIYKIESFHQLSQWASILWTRRVDFIICARSVGKWRRYASFKGKAVALALWMELGVVGLRCGEFWEEMVLKNVNVRNGARVLWMVSVERVFTRCRV
jgi:hypothetical protein